MKKLLLILLTALLMLPAAMRAQTMEYDTVGHGSSSYYYAPFGNWWHYSWTETIYPASEINTNGGFINAITWHCDATTTYSTNVLKIYLGTTDRTVHSSTSDWQAENELELVYDGTNVTLGTGSWQTFTLTNPYYYDGESNLVVVIAKEADAYSSSVKWYYTQVSNSCLYRGSDSDGSYATYPTASATSNSYYRADIILTIQPQALTCSAPKQPKVSEISDQTATFSWSYGNTESSWDIYYTTSTVAPDSLTEPMMTVMDTFAILSNLNSNTIYRAYVRANCGETDGVSNWKATSFRTRCSPANLPYTENFDVYGGTGSDVFPPCWSKVSGTAYISSTAYSEPGALYLSGSSTTPSMAASQAIATEITSTMVSFRAKASSSSYKLIVGVISDPSDASTFVPVDTIIPINTNWIQYDIPLTESTLGGSDISVAFKTTGTYYVDDVAVNEAACPRPTAVQVSDIEGNQVKLSWQTYADVDSWMVKYETGEESVTVPASENPFILSGLQSQTEYKVYVASVCGGIQGEFSADAVTFTTTQVLATLPYTCTFDEELEQSEWSFVNGSCTNRWMIGEGANYGDGSNALYISNNNEDNEYDVNASSIVWAYRDIKFDMPGLFYDFAFDWKCEGQNGEAGKIDYFACYVGPVKDVTYSKNYTLTPPASAIKLFEGNAQSDWQHFEMTSTTSQATSLRDCGTVRLYFVWANNSSKGTQPAVAIDNITVAPNNCGVPTTITVNNITESSATVKWVAFETENMAWEVAYATSTSELETAEPIFVEDTTLTLENLTPATTYYLRVRTICGGTDTTEWSSNKTFKTECSTYEAPFAHNFTSSSTPDCWSKKQGFAADIFAGEDFTSETTSNWSFSSSGYASINIWSTNRKEWLITPAIDLSNVTNPELTFDMWYSSNPSGDASDDQFMVIVSADGGATWTEENATIWNNTGTGDYVYDSITVAVRNYAISLADYEGGTIKIAFYGESTTSGADRYVRINNIKVGVPEGCDMPENVTVSNITTSSATITWNNIENVSWEIAYAASLEELATAEPQPATDTVFELSDLTSATTYYVHVRTVCEGGIHTAWSSTKTFQTDCDAFLAPFTHSFTSSTAPACWSRKQGLAADIFAGGDFSTGTSTYWSFSNGYAEVNIYGEGSYGRKDWLITPMIDLSTVNNPELTFDVWIRSYYNQNPAPDDKFMVIISEDGGATWSQSNATIWSNDGTGDYVYDSITTTHRTYAIPLSDYTASPVKIAFYGESTVSNGDRYLDINNVAIASCAVPTDVAASDVTESEATITWTGTAVSYNLRYKTATDEEWIEELSDVTSPYELAGLTEATPYMFEVQAVCGTEDVSTWVGGVFTTAGGVVPQTCDLTFRLYDDYGDGWNGSYLDVYVNGEYLGSTTLPSGTSGTVPLSINNGDVLTLDWDSNSSYDYEASYEIYSGDELLFEGDAYNYDEFTYTCNTSSCANTVSNLHTTDITTTSISIAWDDEEASAWVVEYAPVGAAEPVVVPVSTTSFYIENLEVATDYVINVKADCGDEQSIPTTLTVKTDCELTAIPYAEDFEEYNAVSYSSTGKLPNCWDAYASSTTASYKPKVATSGSYSFAQSGNKSLTFYTSGNASAVLPAMTEALNTLELGFWYKNYSSSTGKLIVGYVTEADSALNTFTAIDTLENTTTGQQVYYTLDNLTDDAYRIAFKYTTTSTSYTASVDDITLNYIPACAAPSNIATAPASNSITISVEDGADLYEVVYSTVADFDPDLATVVQINNPGDIYNLEPETRYYMYLRTVCEDSHSRWSDIFNDMTASANIAEVPYTCDFEDETENEGWTLLNGTAVNKWFIGEATGNPDHSLYISNDGGTTNAYTNTASANVWAYRDVRFPASTGYPYTLSFDWKSKGETSANDYVKVFIGNLATVTPNTSSTAASAPQGATLVGTFYNQDTWQHVEFDLSDAAYSNTTKRIYILWRNNTSAGVDPSGAIDNIAINYNTCPMPTALRTTYVGGEVVTIAWNQEATDQSNWEVQWKLASDSVWNEAEQVSDANTYTITGLTGTTAYQARVRAICDGETPESSWTEPLNFTTDCVPVVAPWTEPFDSSSTLPQCWKIYSGLAENVFNGTSGLTSTSGYWNTNTNAVLTGRHMKINVYGSSVKYWMVTPTIDMSQLSHPVLTFDLALTDFNNVDPVEDPTDQVDDRFIVAVSTDNGTTWSRANATEWNNDGTGAYSFNNIATAGETILVDLAQYEGQEIKIAFYAESTVSNGDNDLHIDNVTVDEAPSCIWPVALNSTVTPNTATVSWNVIGEASEWEVQYMLASDTNWSLATSVPVTDEPSVLLDGLSAATIYQFRVKTICTDGESEWSSIAYFTTECDVFTAPFVENFENITAGIPLCWDNSQGTTSDDSYKWNAYTNNGRKCVRFNSYSNTSGKTNFLMTPQITLSADMALTFNYKNPTGGDFSVYISTDNGETSELLQGGLTGQSSWEEVFIDLTEYADETVNIIFKGTSNYGAGDAYIYLDDVNIDAIPTCWKPTNLTASNVTTTTVTLAWTENGDAANWNIEYGPAGFVHGQGTTVPAPTNPFTLTGLDASTNYDIYVRADCGGDDLSAWSNVVTISTLCEVFDLPFVEDFNSISSGIPTCWDNSEGTTTTESYKWNYYATGYEGAGLRFNSYINSNGNTNTLKTPAINIVAGASLSFYYKNPTGGDFSVYVIANGTQTLLEGGLTGMSDWARQSYDLSEYAGQGVQIAFVGTSNYGPTGAYIDLDSVAVLAASPVGTCDAPTNLASNNVLYNSADITWTAGGSESAWNLQWRAQGGTWTPVNNLSATNHAMTNLTAETTYEVQVQAVCAEGTSDWTASHTFTTPAAPVDPCNAPSNIQVSNITPNAATVTWTAGGNETSWEVQYKAQSSSQWQQATVQTTTYTIEGLTENTAYDVKVRAICSAANMSDFVSTTFTTTGTGIDNVTLSNSISLMPNPADNYVELTINSNININVNAAAIYNAFGQMVQEIQLTDNHARIDLTNMASGMYFVRVAGDNAMATKKFIKR